MRRAGCRANRLGTPRSVCVLSIKEVGCVTASNSLKMRGRSQSKDSFPQKELRVDGTPALRRGTPRAQAGAPVQEKHR